MVIFSVDQSANEQQHAARHRAVDRCAVSAAFVGTGQRAGVADQGKDWSLVNGNSKVVGAAEKRYFEFIQTSFSWVRVKCMIIFIFIKT